MKPGDLETINQSFAVQAEQFESKQLNFTKEAYLRYTLERVAPNASDTFLEVAAGTCVCGRAFAPLVRHVVCLDATVQMLQVGKAEAEKQQLSNLTFVKGCAEELPFLDHSFDIVFSRLAFHHFTDPEAVFSEMVRVLNPGGMLVLIDMEAAEESLRMTEDAMETLRDPSHVKNLSRTEIQELFVRHGVSVQVCEGKQMEQHLSKWMALTKTPEEVQQEIRCRMQKELLGGEKTGFSPYQKEQDICFYQNWLLTLGRKSE